MKNIKTLVLGANGFLGNNLKEYLINDKNYDENEIIFHNGRNDLNLLDGEKLSKYINSIRPSVIFNCTAFVGGISYGFKYPAKLLHDNSKMVLNLYEGAHKNEVSRIITPISNCAYPGDLNYYEEQNFWAGKPHDSVFNYAFTRRLIVALGKAYYEQHGISSCNLVLSNMYGKFDHFDEHRSHALGAILDKIYKAKVENKESVTIWGTGTPIREWLYVQDGVESLVKAATLQEGNYFFNIGVNKGISIKDLAFKIAEILNWNGTFEYDLTKPDGAIEKRVDGTSSKTHLNWVPQISLDEGLKETIDWYVKQQ